MSPTDETEWEVTVGSTANPITEHTETVHASHVIRRGDGHLDFYDVDPTDPDAKPVAAFNSNYWAAYRRRKGGSGE